MYLTRSRYVRLIRRYTGLRIQMAHHTICINHPDGGKRPFEAHMPTLIEGTYVTSWHAVFLDSQTRLWRWKQTGGKIVAGWKIHLFISPPSVNGGSRTRWRMRRTLTLKARPGLRIIASKRRRTVPIYCFQIYHLLTQWFLWIVRIFANNQ